MVANHAGAKLSDPCAIILYNGRPRWSTALEVRQRFAVMEDGLLPYQNGTEGIIW